MGLERIDAGGHDGYIGLLALYVVGVSFPIVNDFHVRLGPLIDQPIGVLSDLHLVVPIIVG